METKTEKIEWSKPILEELGRVRYSLGTCNSGSSTGTCFSGTTDTCNSGMTTDLTHCVAGAVAALRCYLGGGGH